MKKLLLLLCGLMSLVMSVHAADSEEFDYTYKGNTLKFVILSESERTCAVTGYTSEPVGALELPDCVDYNGIEYSLVEIGRYAFSNCRGLTSIEIPNSVTTIEEGAFEGCKGLTSIEIPNSVTTIGNIAFEGCTGLTSIEIPNSVTTIGEYAFGYCKGLTSIEIPNSVTTIEEGAFEGCKGLTSIEIPNSVTTIGNRAFEGCTGLTSIEIPNSVTTIGEYAFGYCTGLTSIEIPNSVTTIGEYAFYGCTGLTSIKIPNSVTTIEEGAFGRCTGLTSIEIPSSVTYLSGFNSCTRLTSIEIPNSVTTIGKYAFYGCTGLTSIEIPNSVTTIVVAAFSGCTGLTSIELPNSLTTIEASTFYGCSGLTSIELPNSVSTIGGEAFKGCTGLTSIELPNSVTTIKESTFYGCSGLTSIELPNSVSTIGGEAFKGCTGLTSIELPNSVTTIKESTFYGCSGLTSIDIPTSVTEIGEAAFSGCTGLTELAIPQLVRKIGREAFHDVPLTKITSYALESPDLYNEEVFDADVRNTRALYVARESLDDYKKNWSCFRYFLVYDGDEATYTLSSPGTLLNLVNPNDVENITTLKLIGRINGTDLLTINRMTNLQKIDLSEATIVSGGMSYYADDNNIWKTENDVLGGYWAYNLEKLVEVVMPEKLHAIDDRAFFGKILLDTVKIPDSVTRIGSSAFEDCIGLVELTIPESVTTLGASAFKGCSRLANISIPESVTSIDDYVFDGCTGLKEVAILASVTCIGVSAFRNCKGLTALELPGSLTTIEAGAFQNCFALEKISISYQLAEIGSRAFQNCSSLGSIVLPGSIRKIDAYAFNGCSSLTTVSVINPIPAVIQASTFPTADANDVTLVVPEESQGIYWIHPYWGKFGKIETWNSTGETDFMADEVMYHITSENDMTVEVCAVSPENGRSAAKSLEIPQTVFFNSRKYTVTGIANSGLANAGVTSVILPATTAYVGLSAFSGNSGLKTIECNAVVPPSVDQSSFDEGVYSSAELLVPFDAEEAYRNDEVWSLFNIKGVERNILVSELSVNPTEWTGGVGEEFRITATVLPADATCKTLKWSTSDPAVAEVSDDGVVTVTGTGECVITVATVDGSGLTATCHVKIETNGIDSVFERDDHVHIRVYTLAGFCIYEGAADEASLSPGIYIVITADGVEKVVIK